METKQLYSLAIWYDKNILSLNIIQSLRVCNDKIRMALNDASAINNASIKMHKIRVAVTDYIQKLNEIDTKKLDCFDIEILERLGLKYIILNPTVASLEKLLKDNDAQDISARLIDAHNTLKECNLYFTNFLSAFIKIFGTAELDSGRYNDGKVLTRVKFHKEALITNVVNLSDWTSKWSTIARGYSMALGEAPEEFEVVSASKGSIIFDLLLNLEIVNMIGETFNHIADLTLTYFEIRIAIKGYDCLKTSNPKLHKEVTEHLEQQLEEKVNVMADEVADKLLKKFASEARAADGEVKTSLKKSIKELDNFINKGGNIDFKAETDDLEKNEQINLVNDALKQLNNRPEQKRLENK